MIRISSLVVLLVIISQGIIAQNYKKAFNALSNKDYTKARIIFTKAQASENTRAIGDYGMAIVYYSTSLRIEDMYKSYESIVNAEENYDNCDTKVKSKNKDYFSKEKIANEIDIIDKKLFGMVKTKDDIKEYQRHINKCPDSEYNKQSIVLRDKKAFSVATDFNTIPAFEDFISKYPNSKEYTDATGDLRELEGRADVYAEILEFLSELTVAVER